MTLDLARTFNRDLRKRGEKLLGKNDIAICDECYAVHREEQARLSRARGAERQRAREAYMATGNYGDVPPTFRGDPAFEQWRSAFDAKAKRPDKPKGGY